MKTKGNVLVLTVGTGNMEKLEDSLLGPLAKSINEGEWTKAVLLPSSVTEEFAEQLARRFPGLSMHVETLPEPGLENDADSCFEHFDKVLGNLVEEGYAKESIVADFTRGTKAMSAALVLAAVRQDIPRLRYIWGERDQRGMVIPGTERIAKLPTALATWRRRLDSARDLMRQGDFAAVLKLVPDPSNPFAAGLLPKLLLEEAAALRRRASFYGAWDRLDYSKAKELAKELREEDDLQDEVEWVRRLALTPNRDDHSYMARWLRPVTCDLLANGRRRIRDRHFEDALLRAYRVIELVGQFLLFDAGHDSASIDPGHEAVKKLRERLSKKGSQDFGKGKGGRLTAPRELAARLLKELGHPLGEKLLDFGRRKARVGTGSRNHSILIHGFEAAAQSDGESLIVLYDDLETLLEEAEPCAAAMIKAASRCSVR